MAVRTGEDRGVLLAGEAEDSMVRGVAPPTKDDAPPQAMKRAGGGGDGRNLFCFSHTTVTYKNGNSRQINR